MVSFHRLIHYQLNGQLHHMVRLPCVVNDTKIRIYLIYVFIDCILPTKHTVYGRRVCDFRSLFVLLKIIFFF